MTEERGAERRTIEVAERLSEILGALGIESALIGAMALAVHRYVRFTRDLDLATHVDPFRILPDLRRSIEKSGYHAELRLPDADDPRGAVVEVTGRGFKPIQIVNFHNPLAPAGTRLGEEAIREASSGSIERSPLRVVTLPHLIALKLYAGGPKNRNDVIELLERNRPLDPGPIREVCARHGLAGNLEAILSELHLQ